MNLERELDELLLEPTLERLKKFFKSESESVFRMKDDEFGDSSDYTFFLPDITIYFEICDDHSDEPEYMNYNCISSVYDNDHNCITNMDGTTFRVLYRLKKLLIEHKYIKE